MWKKETLFCGIADAATIMKKSRTTHQIAVTADCRQFQPTKRHNRPAQTTLILISPAITHIHTYAYINYTYLDARSICLYIVYMQFWGLSA